MRRGLFRVQGALLGLLLLCSSPWLVAAEEITLFSYQQKPPYIVDGKRLQGLYFDLAARLNASLPAYHFTVREIPRKRLDHLLARNQLDGIVLGVSPEWFADARRHLWSRAFIDDANLLVSRSTGPVSRLSPDGLDGHRLGVVSGHRYPELDSLFERQNISREDGVSENANLLRLQRGWIDAAVVGERTMAFYLHQQQDLQQHLYVAHPPLNRYQRHLLVPVGYGRLLPELNQAIDLLASDPAWQAELERYR